MNKAGRIRLNKIIISGVALICTLSYGMTDRQVQLVKKELSQLQQKEYKKNQHIKSNLKASNIGSYLEYKEISLHPKVFTQEGIDNYFSGHKNNYWTEVLCDDLAIYYAKTKNWKMFKKFYDGDLETANKCWNIKKGSDEGFRQKAIVDFSKFWQTKKYVASECVDIQKYWQGYPNKGRDCVVDKAFNLALENDFDNSLKLLNNNAKQDIYVDYIDDWKKVTVKPKKLDSFIAKYHKNPKFDEILLDITHDSIKTDLMQYTEVWQNLKNKKYLDENIQNEVLQSIAIGFARMQYMQEAKKWFLQVNRQYYSNLGWEWLLRIEIYESDFKDYVVIYEKLPKRLQELDVWKYWLAYSYSQAGSKSKANVIYRELSKKSFNYYAMLSADALGESYSLGSKNVSIISSARVNVLLKDSNILQAVELYKAGQYKDATKLWKWTIRQKFNSGERSEIPELAQLAWLNKMYHQAIFSMGMLGESKHTELLFPKPFQNIIGEQSKKYDLKKSLILAIMRRESLFNRGASSSVGAKGLMQVTIPTADFITKKYNLDVVNTGVAENIYLPNINIKVGTANLNFLGNLFKANLVLGIAAYNAGPGNVDKWLSDKKIPAKQWIESIPFGETRRYIRKVLVNIIVYNNTILDDEKLSLSEVLNSEISKESSFRS